jgi:hypothetical protein
VIEPGKKMNCQLRRLPEYRSLHLRLGQQKKSKLKQEENVAKSEL